MDTQVKPGKASAAIGELEGLFDVPLANFGTSRVTEYWFQKAVIAYDHTLTPLVDLSQSDVLTEPPLSFHCLSTSRFLSLPPHPLLSFLLSFQLQTTS